MLFDPFYHYHGPIGNMKAVLEERDYWVQDTVDNTKWFDFRDLKPTDIQLQRACR